jgi:hypothetical protein
MLTLNNAAYLAILEEAMKVKAEVALEFFQEALDLTGSGIMHPGNVQPSSAPGEYAVRQTGALLNSLDARSDGPLTYDIGSFEDKDAEGYLHADDLETSPPSKGGRPWVTMALHDPELARRLNGEG